MDTYVTCEGTKLTAEFPQELVEKLYQAEPDCSSFLEKSKKKLNFAQKSQQISSENFIAELIQNGYLSVIDPVDG
jgi:hypothetical protein